MAMRMATKSSFTIDSSPSTNGSYPPPSTLTQEEIETKEWKYTGYQHFSRFISSDNDFLFFRRFSVLNARVFLALQDEIATLEHELATLDQASSEKTAPDVHNGSFRADAGSARAKLLHGKIYSKLKKYSKSISERL